VPLQAGHHCGPGNEDLHHSDQPKCNVCQILEQEAAAVLTKGGQAEFSNLDEYFASMNKLATTTTQLWQKSGLSLTTDFKAENFDQFVKDNKLDFLEQPVVNGVTSDGEEAPPKDTLSESVDALLSKN
jgi:hypothetical protein